MIMKPMNHSVSLQSLNWLPHNRKRLEALIAEKSFTGNYAVFDWDFTCIFYDVQDNLFMYQLENIYFKMTPPEFSKMLRVDIGQDVPLRNTANCAGRALTAGELSADLDDLYEFLYAEYAGLGGTKSLEAVTATDEYRTFKAKMIVLMLGAARTFSIDLCQQVSTGMSIAELEALTEKAIDKSLTDEIRIYEMLSAETLPGKAGQVSSRWRKGIRMQPEMQNLINTLNANGIETYVCSASQETPVRVFATSKKYCYNIPSANVFGRRRLLTEAGILTAENDNSIPPTLREGKAEAIKRLIMPKHNDKPPILVAGDSDGDFFMMDAFKDNAVLLVFDRQFDSSTKIFDVVQKGLTERNTQNASVLVQQRNPATGACITE